MLLAICDVYKTVTTIYFVLGKKTPSVFRAKTTLKSDGKTDLNSNDKILSLVNLHTAFKLSYYHKAAHFY